MLYLHHFLTSFKREKQVEIKNVKKSKCFWKKLRQSLSAKNFLQIVSSKLSLFQKNH
jgi:hypothetical protein